MTGLDILFIAGAALFIGYRLYQVLGTRTGHERPPEMPDRNGDLPTPAQAKLDPKPAADNVTPLPRPMRPQPPEPTVTGPAAAGLAAISQNDRSFSAKEFLGGAMSAHDMIVHAFAQGDRDTLLTLLDKPVFDSFDEVMTARQAAGNVTEFTLVSQRSAEFVDAALRGRIGEVTVKFVSEVMSVTRDATGAVIEGAAGAVREVTDIWTFARDTRSSDPNWKLVATGAG
jgi:predicted lipid-binding transport protein (Tim44 family)